MSRKRKTKTSPPKSGPKPLMWRVRVELDSVELTAGHDGPFRGAPEPVLMVGAFFVGPNTCVPLGRGLSRLLPRGDFPMILEPPAPLVVEARVRVHAGSRVAIVAFAVEADSNRGVSRLFESLSDAGALCFWEHDAHEPAPVTIRELAAGPGERFAPPHGARVHVLHTGIDLRDTPLDDDYVGSALLVLPVHRSELRWRPRFVTSDSKNDWTGVLKVRVA